MTDQAKFSALFSPRFLAVLALFIGCLIAANIIAVKLVIVAGLLLPAAVIIFPVSYIVGDVITEVYGYRQARRVIWLGFACNLRAVFLTVAFAGVMPRDAACPFRTRCPVMMSGICDIEPPPVRQAGPDHVIHCHREIDELAAWQRPAEGRA